MGLLPCPFKLRGGVGVRTQKVRERRRRQTNAPATPSTCSESHTQSAASPTACPCASAPRPRPARHYAASAGAADRASIRRRSPCCCATPGCGGGSRRRSAGRRDCPRAASSGIPCAARRARASPGALFSAACSAGTGELESRDRRGSRDGRCINSSCFSLSHHVIESSEGTLIPRRIPMLDALPADLGLSGCD